MSGVRLKASGVMFEDSGKINQVTGTRQKIGDLIENEIEMHSLTP
jgi:hypothetical protein